MRSKRLISAMLMVTLPVIAPTHAAAQQSTTASYFDWLLQCANVGTAPPKKICGIYQTTQVQGKNVTFSRIGIEISNAKSPLRLIAQVPVNVSFRSPVTIELPGPSEPSISASFDRCVPTGCFAEFDVKDDVLKKWKESESVARVSFKDAGGGSVTVPLSFKGFRSAFEALAKQ